MRRFAIGHWRQPPYLKDGRRRGGYGGLQEGQGAHVTEQAAMVRGVVRFVLGGQRERLSQQGQSQQRQDEQRSGEVPTAASR